MAEAEAAVGVTARNEQEPEHEKDEAALGVTAENEEETEHEKDDAIAEAEAAVGGTAENEQEPKKRVVFAQMDDRANNAKYLPFLHLNQAYCARHGYEHQYHQHGFVYHHPTSGNTHDIPAYWLKPFFAHHVLLSNEDVHAVVIADTDAVVHRQEITVESFLDSYPSKSFLLAPDPLGK